MGCSDWNFENAEVNLLIDIREAISLVNLPGELSLRERGKIISKLGDAIQQVYHLEGAYGYAVEFGKPYLSDEKK